MKISQSKIWTLFLSWMPFSILILTQTSILSFKRSTFLQKLYLCRKFRISAEEYCHYFRFFFSAGPKLNQGFQEFDAYRHAWLAKFRWFNWGIQIKHIWINKTQIFTGTSGSRLTNMRNKILLYALFLPAISLY